MPWVAFLSIDMISKDFDFFPFYISVDKNKFLLFWS